MKLLYNNVWQIKGKFSWIYVILNVTLTKNTAAQYNLGVHVNT